MPASPGPGRVLIATSGGPLAASPSWARYDNLADCRCEGFDSFSGRQSEFDTTDTGNARVFFHDRSSTLRSTDLVGKQIMLQLYDPVAEAWHPRWRGHIDDVVRRTNPFAPLSDTEVVCVDIFDYLGGAKFVPDEMGDALPTRMAGVVFYEDGPADDRATGILDDFGVSPSMYQVFSLNVDVNETLYDSDDVALQGLRDVVDAEFPSGLAAVYVDRFGRVAVHGRFARFLPDDVSDDAGTEAWDFQRWQAATAPNVGVGVAQIRTFGFNMPRSRIINSYVAWPKADELGFPFKRKFIPDQVRTDSGSVSAYGWHGRDATDLIIKEHKTNSNTGAEECQLFADFYVANYAEPRENIQTLTISAIRPDTADARAAATWETMCRMDISDQITVTVAEEGISAVDFNIEGVAVTCRRSANPAFDIVTVTPNLSPAAYYGTDVFS